MFPEGTTYDEAARYLLTKGREWLVVWMLRLKPDHVRFDGWENSVVTLPGGKERICDAVARLADLEREGFPVACLFEVQTRPDPDMSGRLMVAGGICRMTVKPSEHPGDRYGLAAVVINLTGKGNSSDQTVLGGAEFTVKPQEWDFESLDANEILNGIVVGTVPPDLMPFVSVMQKGGEEGTIKKWKEIASWETDLRKRGDLSLAVVFANALGRQEEWKKALEGFDMIESSVVNDWKAAARLEGEREGEPKGERKGERKGKAEAVVQVLEARHGPVPEEVKAAIRGCDDPSELDPWLRAASLCSSIDQFRTDARFPSRG